MNKTITININTDKTYIEGLVKNIQEYLTKNRAWGRYNIQVGENNE